jgi:hypothetical protein
MARNYWLMIFGLGLLAVTGGRPAWSEEPVADGWSFYPSPYIWALGLNGDSTVKGVSGSIDASFIDIIDEADSIFAYNGRFNAVKGDWTIQFTPSYAKIGADSNEIANTTIKFDATTTLAIVEATVLYQLAEWPVSANQSLPQTISFEPLLGGRYTYMNGELDFKGGPFGGTSVDQDKHWFDPFLGGRFTLTLAEGFLLSLRGDIGGFSVGSDVTWQTVGLIGYGFKLFGREASVIAGYRALHQDFEDGSGRGKFKWDMTMHGPVLGLSVRF